LRGGHDPACRPIDVEAGDHRASIGKGLRLVFRDVHAPDVYRQPRYAEQRKRCQTHHY